MIFVTYDYLEKYSDTLSEIIALARKDGNSFEHIEKTIASSPVFKDFENSVITDIAFSSSSHLYHQMFPNGEASIKDIPLFNPSYWVGETYIHIFLKYKLTFEALFTYIPIEAMFKQYDLYHEMDISQFDEYFETLLKENALSKFLRVKKVSAVELSKRTNISVATLRSIKEGRRDIKKMQAAQIEKIASALGINIRSLLNPISLNIVTI